MGHVTDQLTACGALAGMIDRSHDHWLHSISHLAGQTLLIYTTISGVEYGVDRAPWTR